MEKKVLRILSVSGSIMAFHVGSGFASGQEILQFYTSYGPLGGLCVVITALTMFILFSVILLETGRLHTDENPRALYQRLGGKTIGGFFYCITPLIMILVLFVTVAGGGTTLHELFAIPPLFGRILTALPVLLTVLLGLQWITAISGSIGPVIIVCALLLGCLGILRGRDTMLWSLLQHTSGHWFVSAVSYACFGTITQIPFLLTIGTKLKSRREALLIAVLGNGGYMLTGLVLHMGLYRSLPLVLGEQLPSLCLAKMAGGFAGWFYGIILLFSIFTTAVPLLWSVCRAIHTNERSIQYRCSAAAIGVLAAVGSQLPFDRLLGVLYPYIGYISTVFFAVMSARAFAGKICVSFRTGHSSSKAA
ncbi:MAG: hypothetical protein IJ412_03785 [Oscillospiraceae bacterium]|nr:hypothetical protein [Oscillospiraceae bacterium]